MQFVAEQFILEIRHRGEVNPTHTLVGIEIVFHIFVITGEAS